MADVKSGLEFAQRKGWSVVSRCAGNSWPHWSLREDVVVIDTRAMATVKPSSPHGLFRVGPGASCRQVAEATALRARFFPCGHASTLTMGGYLTQGGIGWRSRELGWATNYVVSACVVTADGSTRVCSSEENPDLFWAVRGAGPGLCAVVTEFEIATLPSSGRHSVANYAWPRSTTYEVLHWFLTARSHFPDAVEVTLVLSEATGGGIAAGLTMTCFEGNSLEDIGAYRPPAGYEVAAISRGVSLFELFDAVDQANPQGRRWAVDSAFLVGKANELAPAVSRAAAAACRGSSYIMLGDFSPAMKSARNVTAAEWLSDLYMGCYASWLDDDEDIDRLVSLNEAMRLVNSFSVGSFIGDSDLSWRRSRIMSSRNWRRLSDVWRRYDPEHLFAGYLGEPLQGLE